MVANFGCPQCGTNDDHHAIWCGQEPGYCGNSICPHLYDPIEAGVITPENKIKSDGGSSDYYRIPPGAKEIQDLVEHRDMNFAIGNIFKAAYRLGRKAGNDELYELRKIKWYVERELERLTKLQQEKA